MSDSVDVAAKSGSHLRLLKAMRERIANAVADEDCPPRDLAALTRRLQDIAREIDTLEERARAEGRTLDDNSDETTTENGGEDDWDPKNI